MIWKGGRFCAPLLPVLGRIPEMERGECYSPAPPVLRRDVEFLNGCRYCQPIFVYEIRLVPN